MIEATLGDIGQGTSLQNKKLDLELQQHLEKLLVLRLGWVRV